MTAPNDNANHFIGSSSLQDDMATIAAARDAGESRSAQRQTEAHQFIIENGAAVLDGHDPQMVIRPGHPTPMTGDVWDPTAT